MKTFKKVLLLLFASIVAWILVTEIFLRSFFPQTQFLPYALKNGVYIRQPGFKDWISTSKFNPFCWKCPRTIFQLDEDGQRVDDLSQNTNSDPNRPAVLFVGASVTAGMFSTFENTFPQQFQKLNGKFNAKTCTTFLASTKDLFGLYKNLCRNYQSVAVVLQITASNTFASPDFIFRDNFGPSPIASALSDIPEQRYTVKIDDSLSYADFSLLSQQELTAIESRLSFRPLPYEYSHLFRLIFNSWKKRTDVQLVPSLYIPNKETTINNSAALSERTLSWILAIKKLVEEDNRSFSVFIVPTGDLARQIVKKNELPERWKKLLSLLIEQKVEVISGFNFLTGKDRWEPYYYKNDLHPTDLGYKELAKQVVRHFDERL